MVSVVVIPCRHFRQVEFAEHIDARERCQHLAPFRQCQLHSFWLRVMPEYPQLSDAAVELLPIASTYLCEAGFSKLMALKTK